MVSARSTVTDVSTGPPVWSMPDTRSVSRGSDGSGRSRYSSSTRRGGMAPMFGKSPAGLQETRCPSVNGLSRDRGTDRGVDAFAARADDLDAIVLAELLADGGLGEVGLPVHEAGRRVAKLGRHPHHRG